MRSRVLASLFLCAAALAAAWPAEEGKMSEKSAAPGVEHVVLAQLGEEHLANAVLRRAAGGDRLVAWGNRVLEWPLSGQEDAREVVPLDPRWEYSNGGCAMDVDGDGLDEIVVARANAKNYSSPEVVWLKETPGQPGWEVHPIAGFASGPHSAPHDFRPVSFRRPGGESVRGVATTIGRQRLVWFEIPADPRAPWVQHEIATLPAAKQSGMAVGDVAGKGRTDVVSGMFWAECPADPTRETWTVRRFGDWDSNGWGGMAKLALGDVDGDGKLEIVAAEAEIPESRLGVFRRDPAKPDGLWRYQPVATGLYCPHSLVLADLDEDGRLDIVVGEMTAGGWSFPMNPSPRILAFHARGGGRYEGSTLVTGWGIHEMGVAPGRRDGKVLLYAADEIQRHKFKGMNTHVSLWRVPRL